MDELTEKIDRLTAKHRSKVADSMGLDPSAFEGGTLEEKTAHAEVLRDAAQNVLFTLGQLAAEFPEVSDVLAQRLEDYNLQMPPRPPSQSQGASRTGTAGTGTGGGRVAGQRGAGTTYSGRPGTGGSDVMSSKSSNGSGAGAGTVRLPPIPGAQSQSSKQVRQQNFNMGL